MFDKIFPCAETLAWLESGAAAPFVQAYARSLQEAGFKLSTMRHRIHAAAHLGHWLDAERVPLAELDGAMLERFRAHLPSCRCAHSKPGEHAHTAVGVARFLEYLRETGVATAPPATQKASAVLLEAFSEWLRRHRGVTEKTVDGYRHYVKNVVDALGDDPPRYEASAARRFVLAHLHGHPPSYVKRVGTVLRMFFRFLVAEGLCRVELVDAVPKTANWTLTDIPRHLSSDAVERVIAAPDERSRCCLRDRAVVLLLARLGLRARDIVDLALSDIDWRGSRIRVTGKGRRETWLPLPQEAGDALLDYLQHARPPVADDHVFLRVRAPICRFKTSGSVSVIVHQAIRRAGVQSPPRGAAHLFRHSLAKRLLAQDVPLEAIGVVLRHRSLETTAKYAKLDVGMLLEVVQPWPAATGALPC
jgi:integrase/recombinase XerD